MAKYGTRNFGNRISGTIEDTVAGDVFQFKQTSGINIGVEGTMTVSEDEMTGAVSTNAAGRETIRLRRLGQ
jgi:hypothetical protein